MKVKILILYFSATGNTHFAASLIKKKLDEKRIHSDIKPVEIFPPKKVEEYDLLIFGFPIYALEMPTFLESFVEKIPFSKDKSVILFSTMAFYGGNALRKASKKFFEKGFLILTTDEMKLPGSDGLLFAKKNSRFVKKIFSKNYANLPHIKKSVENIVNTVSEFSKSKAENTSYIPRFKALDLPLEIFMKLVLPPIENHMKNRFWVDESKCVKCGTCAKICPVKNIEFKDGKITFSNKCYLCLRCVHQCPTEAINIGKFTKNTVRWKGPDHEFNALKVLSQLPPLK